MVNLKRNSFSARLLVIVTRIYYRRHSARLQCQVIVNPTVRPTDRDTEQTEAVECVLSSRVLSREILDGISRSILGIRKAQEETLEELR